MEEGLTMANYLLLSAIFGWIFFLGTLACIGIVLMKFPSITVMILAKRYVWEIFTDGNMRAKKAEIIASSYVTKNASYDFERFDVVNCHGKQCIIVNASTDSKAIRPYLQPLFKLMKKLNVSNREKLDVLLSAPLVTKEEYEKAQEKAKRALAEAMKNE